MNGWSFALQWVAAVLLLIMLTYFPGRLCLRWLRVPLDPLEHLTAALVAGTGLLVLVYWGISLLHFQRGLWFYLLLGFSLEMWFIRQDDRRRLYYPPDPDVSPTERLSVYWPLGLCLLLGMAVQTRFTLFTGWEGQSGLSLLAWHGHDAPWHIYNIEQLSRQFPPVMPGFSGYRLNNYHMFSDLLWGALGALLPINAWHLYFRVAPLFYSGLLTLTTFVAARAWTGSLRTAYLTVALTLLAGNFAYAMPLFFGSQKYFIWDSIFWVQSPFGTIFNPGVSSSYAFVWMGIWSLVRWLKEHRVQFLLLLALFWGVLPGFKVYPALLVISALFIAGVLLVIFQRTMVFIIAWVLTLPLFLLVFIWPNLHAPALVRILPGFNLATMLVAPDRMALMSALDLKILFAERPWLVALIMVGLLLVFLVGNLGIRSLGLIKLVKDLRDLKTTDPILLFIACVVLEALGASVLLVQKGVQWNTIQFFYYAVLLMSLPAAAYFWSLSDRLPRSWQWGWLALFLGLSLPGTLQALWVIRFQNTASRPVCQALAWLRQNAPVKAVILKPLPTGLMAEEGMKQWQRNQERGRMTSLHAWQQEASQMASQTSASRPEAGAASGTAQSSLPTLADAEAGVNTLTAKSLTSGTSGLERTDAAIVASLTNRNTFLEDTVSAQIMGYPVEARVAAVRHFYQQADVIEAREFIEKERISYVILYPGMVLPFQAEGLPLTKVFENEAITIYKYTRVWQF